MCDFYYNFLVSLTDGHVKLAEILIYYVWNSLMINEWKYASLWLHDLVGAATIHVCDASGLCESQQYQNSGSSTVGQLYFQLHLQLHSGSFTAVS